ncbi:MAG: WD40/YVTN/BNR-like repeat-containing protein, partial [Chloroflexota bacterium]
GDSWETVVTVDQRDGPAPVLVVTPTLDGPVLAKIGALLFHAADPRAAWGEVMLPDELQVQDLAPSPAYAQDGLIFAALIRTASWYGSGPVPEPVVTAHERSLGVAVSSDGGLTWQPVGSQPEIEGVSYRQVRTLAVSPTFATDRTLFVHAWGPYLSPAERGGQPVRVSHESVLFRSRDAGATWEVVDRDNLGGGGNYAMIALSPRFATDGVALMARATAGSISTCILSRSTDVGASWVELRRKTGKAQACPAPRMLTQNGQLKALLGHLGISEWSDDGGATWARISSPPGSSPVLVPATGEKATIYAGGSRGGVYALGPGAAATDGRLPCALQPAPQLAALLNAEPSLRAPLGCPQELERPVTVRERELTLPREDPVHGYWIEGQDTNWIAVRRERAPFDPSGARWTTESKLTRPWPADGHSVRTGTIQRFEGGMILTLANDGGGRTALVFVNLGGAYQRELP